jgi:hypothetical protein
MAKRDLLSVKHVAAVAGKGIRVSDSRSRPVKRVARQGVARKGKMNANLVGSSRFDPDLQN